MTATATDRRPHSAKWSAEVLRTLAMINHHQPLTAPIVDPFAGIGNGLAGALHLPDAETPGLWGIELQPQWADHPDTPEWIRQGDALDMLAYPAKIGTIVTSPTYGNRMADRYRGPVCPECVGDKFIEAEGDAVECPKCLGSGHDGTGRRGYAIDLGEIPADGSSATLQWGQHYKAFHHEWLRLMHRIVPVGERRLIINMSDHYRDHQRQHVCAWWIQAAADHHFALAAAYPAATRRHREGANAQARAGEELVLVFHHEPNPNDQES